MWPFNYKIIFLILVTFLVAGCGVSSQNSAHSRESKKDIKEFSIVEAINEKSILIGDIYYKVSHQTKMEKADGQKLQFSELKPGDLIALKDEGYVLESFPGQGSTTSIILQNDEESLKVSESIRHFIENQKKGSIISINIEQLSAESITLHFFEWEIHGKKYEAVIDRLSNEFVVTEIPNEEALEQERIRRAMAEAHPEGSTSGRITKIYEEGFRVNMADYMFAKDVQFTNDLGKTIFKDDFKVGSFVSVDYDVLKHEEMIGEGVLSKLMLLTKEDNPDVQRWIESVVTGNEFKEAAIMMSYTDTENYYAIRVADLKDDTYDTFELKYDFNSGTHTTSRNVHKK